jgi:gamma-polyglutamate biosynthesis protein CapA
VTALAGTPALTAVGDIMLGDSSICVGFGFHSRYPGARARDALGCLGDRLRQPGVVFGNLECPLTAVGAGGSRWRRDQMRGDPDYASILREIGFTAIGVANNHATQHGREAFEETVGHLRAAGILCVGVRGSGPWTCEPAVQTIADDRSVGLLGYCWRPRQYGRDVPPFAEGRPEEVLADVDRLRGSVGAVIVSLHWGEEFVGRPSEAEAGLARAIIEAGAIAVIGHHPHVLRPCERRGNGVIAYSLGNFTSDMLWQNDLRAGGILDCSWDEGRLRHASLTSTFIGRDYRPILGATMPIPEGPLGSLQEDAYRMEVERSLRAQRVSAYRYAAAHLLQYPLSVAGELAWVTTRNKLDALWHRSAGRSA